MEMVHYLCISYNISKSDATLLLENLMLDDRGLYKMYFRKKSVLKINFTIITTIKAKKLDTKRFSIDKKNYKDLTIYFARHNYVKSMKMLSLYYYELIGKIEEH